MSYTLIFLALLMAAVVWWLVKQTINMRPWDATAVPEAVRSDGVRSFNAPNPLSSTKVALGVFLAVVTSLFALFISAYSIRMEYGDWRPMPEPLILWINSGLLVLSSVVLQSAWHAASRGNLGRVRTSVAFGGALAIAFIVGQLLAWKQLVEVGYLIQSNPANAFFYTLTALHALASGGRTGGADQNHALRLPQQRWCRRGGAGRIVCGVLALPVGGVGHPVWFHVEYLGRGV